MYARYKFFEEQNIEIDPSKLEQTLLLNPKLFMKKYGEQVISQEEKEKMNLDDKGYAIIGKHRLKEKYPLPNSIYKMKEEFKKKEIFKNEDKLKNDGEEK